MFLTVGLLPLLTVRLADRWLGRRGPLVPAVAPVSPIKTTEGTDEHGRQPSSLLAEDHFDQVDRRTHR